MGRYKYYLSRVIVCLLMGAPMRLFAVGWTPTAGGLVVNLKPEDKILISVMVDHDNNSATPDREYFVENYTRYTGDDYFTYSAGYYLKLVQQAAGATEPSEMSVWTVDSALTRVQNKVDYAMGGISYTLWNDQRTLRTDDSKDKFKFYGDLADDIRNEKLCDAVFVVPTNYSTITSFDPNKTLTTRYKRDDQDSKGRFNGKTGTGFLGMTYREVYWMVIPRFNVPISYTNAAVVTFNTTKKDVTWSAGTIKPGRAAYAYADTKHHPTTRTVFRLYILNEPINSCGGYFFAYDEQNTLRYRQSNTMTDSTARQKIYTMDRLSCMDRVEDTKYYQTGGVIVPAPDSSYFYVGSNNDYRNGSGGSPSEPLGSSSAKSQFTPIRELPMKNLAGKYAPAGAHGRMVVDTTSSADNLDVKFEPTGYFLKVNTNKNVRMKQLPGNQWISEEMWTITPDWAELYIKATLMTGASFSESDPGADIEGWSVDVQGKTVLVYGTGESCAGKSGYARITVTSTDPNGHLEFVLANKDTCIHYDNNGFLGVQIPDQYPFQGDPIISIEESRIKSGYTFLGWNTKADGTGKSFNPGEEINLRDLPEGVALKNDTLFLYAQGTYNGTYNVAMSFIHPTDGKRYFLTHPNASTPRYARARHIDEWTNAWQGMSDDYNTDPNYVCSFELRHPSNEIHKKADPAIPDLQSNEFVLDPRRYTMKGYEDSLVFYEDWAPSEDEYLGLYYSTPNTIVANNTWAGLFTTTSALTPTGWPDFRLPYIPSAKLKSERYVEEYDPENKKDSLMLKVRGNSDRPFVKFNVTDNQFDGVATAEEATEFEISAIVVADAHYVVLPDTSEVWRDTIEFGYHQSEQTIEPVWSKLIGKQLMACMMVGGDTTYFHPNRKKIFNTPQDLYISSDFRLSQEFEFIRDSRVSAALNEGDSVMMQETDHYWCNNIVSGNSSPLNVTDGSGNYIDIIDTVRIRLGQGGVSKIKDYYGRWKNGAAGLHVKGATRYRDVIIRTKTYHEGTKDTVLVLTPEYETYSFSPLGGISKRINFTLTRVVSQALLDVDGNEMSKAVLSVDTLKNTLALGPGMCSFSSGSPSAYFDIDNENTTSDHVTLVTKVENTSGVDHDTLTVTIPSITITVESKSYTYTDIKAHVPLMQAALTSNELLWSVVDNGKRYFILAKDSGLVFRQYRLNNSILYKENTSTHLIKGTLNDANTDNRYITPWEYTYVPETTNQLTLMARLVSNNWYFMVKSSNPTVSKSGLSNLTYDIVASYTNDNANYEEQVKLKVGDNQWLKFTGGVSPSLSLTTNENEASIFSWSYLVQEYNLLNNGAYPTRDYAEFGYNDATPVSVQTRYKAYKEYSTLLNNSVTYLCRSEETNIANLRNSSWLTDISINLVRDSRFGAEKDSSKLAITPNYETLTTTVAPNRFSPIGTQYGGEYVNIVDTLDVRLILQSGAPAYRFKGDWSKFKSVEDAHLKIPLIRMTYHLEPFDSLYASVENDQFSYTFPASIVKGSNDSCVFTLTTWNRTGSHMLDVEGNPVRSSGTSVDVSDGMDFTDKNLAEVRLADEYGNIPGWCKIRRKTKNSIVIECTQNGVRSPRNAYLYFAYIIMIDDDSNPSTPAVMRFVNYRLTVSQESSFIYANNQTLTHTKGASGDEMTADGRQQVHENRRVLYYYPDQDVELPVRERAFYGWWRWYREGNDVNGVDVSDTDIPDSLWRNPPRNEGKYTFPFRIIGDSVKVLNPAKADAPLDPAVPDSIMQLVTMGRYTVFHYKSRDYANKNDPPAKSPYVAPPVTTFGGAHPVLTYVVDISNYYDNLPMSVKDKNQVDVALLDTILEIKEPTLSLREIFELRPWTEMADRMESYKSAVTLDDKYADESYMEDHVVMAPIGNRLLLQTEQRYVYDHLDKQGHSESLLGYYMHDDNKATWAENLVRKDTMIWCGGWDADCAWYIYNAKNQEYDTCTHTITEEDDFLQVPAKTSIPSGKEFDTVYYCLRARSWKTLADKSGEDSTVVGDYWFNICRYKIIYHNPRQYGPLTETQTRDGAKALISNDEIEQRYEVLERLNFDYIKPGKSYHVYHHPLPWADASYGFTYPETADLPHNRYHNESDFPNHGEYGLINRIPYTAYWRKIEQHGGAENGYMIYCDGMSSSGQVAALSLTTTLCAGQKMFFSAYVGNPSSQTGKSNPNFIFSVQGSLDGVNWDDITSYMTGDIQPSDKWYQIYFPIIHTKSADEEYSHFRVRIYNVAHSFDGNDFIIDDMCIFATKPPLIVYQANTTCKKYGEDDADTHVLLRLDYQGITGEGYNGKKVYYTVKQLSLPDSTYSFVPLEDGYLEEGTAKAILPATQDTLFGQIYIPLLDYEPEDSIFRNMNALLDTFDATFTRHQENPSIPIFREGYIYEILEGEVRPVKYIIHRAQMDPKNDYTVHMSGEFRELMSSMCGMTSHLKISNRMVLELNGLEQPEVEVLGLCANSTYDLSMRVKGSLYLDSVAPIDVEGSCINDWLLYGDTARASSKERYGYYYNDIVHVVKDILRCAPQGSTNANQFAPKLTSVSRNEMQRIMDTEGVDLETTDHPYDVLAHLVNNGFLQLYKRKVTVTVTTGDSVEYVILPIVGTGSKEVVEANVEVCPNPIHVKMKPNTEAGLPLIVGGLHRDSTQWSLPVDVLLSSAAANSSFKLRVDSIMPNVGIYSIELRSTDDPDYISGVHRLALLPDKDYPTGSYYVKGDSILLRPAGTNNYLMKGGYNYTFNIVMQTIFGNLKLENGCEVGVIPVNLAIVPDYLRWEPQSSENNNWNEADNWVAINSRNEIIDLADHFVPMAHTSVLIPKMEGGLPYPVLSELPLPYKDSVQKVNFQYNTCLDIRFLPEAAMAQQQRMTYTDAVIDMSMPYNKWAFRAAPVKGMISGDLFRSNADISNETPLWETGEFDAAGRNHTTGNASFWLSLYSRTTLRKGNGDQTVDTVRNATADWSKVTNGLSLPLPAGLGWAIYSRSNVVDETTNVRLPKFDDKYYYYTRSGEKMYDLYEQNLQTLRTDVAGGSGAGQLAFHADYEEYTITNDENDGGTHVETTSFVFGNPSMGYIDIWGFVADNCLKQEIDYIDPSGTHRTVTQAAAESDMSSDLISNQERYLPPMYAMVVKLRDGQAAVSSKTLVLNSYRILTEVTQKVPAIYACGGGGGDQGLAQAPQHHSSSGQSFNRQFPQGIMTVTAINPVSPRCNSRLLIGQGYHDAVREGEDAVLTTVNIDNFHMTNTPTTPFNIYAMEDGYGLSIDLRDSIVNVPLAFYMSALPYDPTTQLWFTGVNNIDGTLVLYDALLDTEHLISDGICITIETPEANHQRRYYIRRRGFNPDGNSGDEGLTTGIGNHEEQFPAEEVQKIIREGHVLILRGGHVYTMFGQKVR